MLKVLVVVGSSMVNIVSHMERFSWGMASLPHMQESESVFSVALQTTGKEVHRIPINSSER